MSLTLASEQRFRAAMQMALDDYAEGMRKSLVAAGHPQDYIDGYLRAVAEMTQVVTAAIIAWQRQP